MRALLACVVVAGAALALLAVPLGGSGKVLADNPPHVAGTDVTMDWCAGCHGVHTRQAARPLKEAQSSFCYSCHGTGGLGADTAVQEGRLYGTGGSVKALKGGGFDSALIDTDDPFGANGKPHDAIGILTSAEPATSWHSIDGSSGGLWGNGALNSGTGGSYSLRCGSCHDPHGNGKYRILRSSPPGAGGGGQDVTDEGTKDYDTADYFDVSYLEGAEISGWCMQCHTRYLAPVGSAATDSGDSTFAYRHMSDGTAVTCNQCHDSRSPSVLLEASCIQCHVAHGSNAITDNAGYSEGVSWPDGGPASGENSRLLRTDNRGICQKCHKK